MARPTSGGATVFGHDVVHATNDVRSLIGFLPDVPGYYPWMTAEEFLRFSGKLFGVKGPVLDERVESLLAMAGLQGVRQRVGGFSRGMKQRLGVAQALINAPRVLMLDEPTSALDPMGRKDVLEMIAALRGRTTVFFSTHILTDVERVCDTVAILDKGRVVREATMAELKSEGHATRLLVEVERGSRGARAMLLAGQPWVVECIAARGRSSAVLSRMWRPPGADPRDGGREGPRARPHGGRGADARRRLRRTCRGAVLMHGFAVFLGKEFTEILRTWRLYVVPGILLFFG
jgi:ABC-2 type transport system ATP-binding protein